MSAKPTMKKVLWVSSSKGDLMDMPEEVRKDFGYGLHQAQMGQHPDIAEALSGFGGASVFSSQIKRLSTNSDFAKFRDYFGQFLIQILGVIFEE